MRVLLVVVAAAAFLSLRYCRELLPCLFICNLLSRYNTSYPCCAGAGDGNPDLALSQLVRFRLLVVRPGPTKFRSTSAQPMPFHVQFVVGGTSGAVDSDP